MQYLYERVPTEKKWRGESEKKMIITESPLFVCTGSQRETERATHTISV